MKTGHHYAVYITTNKNRTVLYIGVTNNLKVRLSQHKAGAEQSNPSSFNGKYKAYYLIYYEHFTEIIHAITREKQLKKWRREKKVALINSFNPEWRFLEDEI